MTTKNHQSDWRSVSYAVHARPPTLLDDATDLLLEAGFLLQHTAHARMGKVRDLLQRATVRTEEVALIRGMVRQLRWAIRSHRP